MKRTAGIFNGTLIVILLCILVLVVSSASAGRGSRRPDMGMMGHEMNPDSPETRRQQELEEKTRQAAELLGQIQSSFFTTLNAGKDIEPEKITAASDFLRDHRRYMMRFDDMQKAQYSLVQAWVHFYQDELSQAIINSGRACKTDGNNKDAWISQQFFSALQNKRPLRPMPPRGSRSKRNGRHQEGMMDMTYGQTGFGSQGTLQFEPESIQYDMLGKTLDAGTLTFMDGSTLEIPADSKFLIAFFWQLEASTNLGDTSPKKEGTVPSYQIFTNTGTEGMEGMEGDISFSNQSNHEVAEQIRILERMMETEKADEKLAFFGVNTNSPREQETVQAHLAKDPQPWPQLFSAQAPPALRAMAEKPFAVVISPEGKVQFAGSAKGFVLPFLMRKLTGIEFEARITESAVSTEAGMMTSPMEMYPEMYYDEFRRPSIIPLIDPNKPFADPNAPFVDPNLPVIIPRPKTVSKPVAYEQAPAPTPATQATDSQYRQLSMEEQVQADKLLTYARDLFMKGAKRRFFRYDKGINACRRIIKDYPGSRQAAEALNLLRQVPEKYRAQYELTPEELGLEE